jgi:hypothetical protein
MFKKTLNGIGVFVIFLVLGIVYNYISTGNIDLEIIFGFSIFCTIVFLVVDYFKNKKSD